MQHEIARTHTHTVVSWIGRHLKFIRIILQSEMEPHLPKQNISSQNSSTHWCVCWLSAVLVTLVCRVVLIHNNTMCGTDSDAWLKYEGSKLL